MKLTRRDALAALSFAGAAVGGGVAADRLAEGGEATLGEDLLGADADPPPVSRSELTTVVAVAEVVYPDRLDGVAEFVETYTRGRLLADEDRREGLSTVLAELDEVCREWEGSTVADLAPADRDAFLRELSVDDADPAPDGLLPGQVRYYLVNDLLYALYASPTGGEMVGTPNPIGHPGGYRTQLSPEYERASPAATHDPTATRDSTTDGGGDGG
ncbi:gluconate 2-dehydrogenase subunit 3 family protein [Halobaculum sp. MBLA0143]|uniref:gluconate 2-dehydrogenase subunit 3 family protein n=1 Tax=Halobaculum sp. MBLA0143 TaxID=3079933 RepID=UPI003525178E